MKRASISQLREHLNDYIEQVRKGETIEIVDRKIPVARVVPTVSESGKARQRDQVLIKRLLRSGQVKAGSLRGVPEILKRLPPGPTKSGVLEALLAERAEGR
jgi:prevent-host-death family protein